MTQDELVKLGVNRFRRAIWACPTDYVRIDIFEGFVGPWMTLWARSTQEAIGEPTPQRLLNVNDNTTDYLPYNGPRDPKDTYL